MRVYVERLDKEVQVKIRKKPSGLIPRRQQNLNYAQRSWKKHRRTQWKS